MENILELINLKLKKYQFFKKLNVFLASLFSLIGTISIVSLLMFLNMCCGVGYFTCIVLTFLLSRVYSFVVNESLLAKIQNKMNDISFDVVSMVNDLRIKKDLELDIKDNNIKQRFDNLSVSRQLELLRYVRNDLKYIDGRELNKLCLSSKSVLDESDNMKVSLENGYSRSRNIRDEIRGKH